MKSLAALAAVLLLKLLAAAQPAPKSVTIPITLDHNRTIIDVYLQLPDGKPKRVRAWVDNGNTELWITKGLADNLGLLYIGDPSPGDDPTKARVEAPRSLQIGGTNISLSGIKDARAILDRESVAPGCSAEITLPSTVLRNYDVLFDYPNRQFTVGPPGSIPFKGSPTKILLDPQTGLIQVPSKIETQESNLALDVGASITLLSAEQIAQWRQAQPSWPYMIGGVAAGNMWGGDEETRWPMLRIPSIQFGSATLTNVAVAAFPEEELKWFQKRAGVPTMGLIGANALVADRVGIDYAHNTLYLERTTGASPPDMDVVGLMLRPGPDRRYTVIGIADYDGKPSVPDAKRGDILLGVDGAPATGATMGQVWSLLGGAPGQTRTLTLEREGKRFTVDAPVRRFLPLTSPTPAKSPRRNPHGRS
jgi:hypothetical protein